MFLLNIPENPSDLANIPEWAMDAIKPYFNYGGVYVTGSNVSIFHYDNDTFILYAHVTNKAHPIHVKIHLQDENARLTQMCMPKPFPKEREIELIKNEFVYDFEHVTEAVGEVILNPGEFYVYRVDR